MTDHPREPIQFRFDERKATAAAAYLLELNHGVMESMRLVKLLYFAERAALARLGRPITGDLFFALSEGPVLGNVLALCEQHRSSEIWSRFIGPKDASHVTLMRLPDVGPLSDAETGILQRIAQEHAGEDRWTLGKIAQRDFHEWRDPRSSRAPDAPPGAAPARTTSITPGTGSLPLLGTAPIIQPEAILHAVGKTAEQIEDIRDEARYDANLDKIFGS